MASAEGDALQATAQENERILGSFKNALDKHDTSPDTATAALAEAMPSSFQREGKMSPDANQTLETNLRTLLQQLVDTATTEGQSVIGFDISQPPSGSGDAPMEEAAEEGSLQAHGPQGAVFRLLDLVLHLCDSSHMEGGVIFQLLEDLMTQSTISDCQQIFEYIESKKNILGKEHLLQRGKLVLLRACNHLLKRLSKSQDLVFCGRVLMFLAYFFPIAEKSAVNIKGSYNTANKTEYERTPPTTTEGATDEPFLDFNFYTTLWSLQEFFSNPPSAAAKWSTFSSSLKVVLDVFAAQPLVDEDVSDTSVASALGDHLLGAYNMKYLTSPSLLNLELKDSSFRRQVLLQCLVLFDFLMIPGKQEKDDKREAMRAEVKVLQKQVKQLLRSFPSGGKEFLSAVEHVLARDKNWVTWKKEGCHPFDRPPAVFKSSKPLAKRPRYLMGNKELDRIFRFADKQPGYLTDPSQLAVPEYREFLRPLADDMDPANEIDADLHRKNDKVFSWRALRLAAMHDAEAFNRFGDMGIEGLVPPDMLPEEVRQKLHKTKPKKDGVADGPKGPTPPKGARAAVAKQSTPPPPALRGMASAKPKVQEEKPSQASPPAAAQAKSPASAPAEVQPPLGSAITAQKQEAEDPDKKEFSFDLNEESMEDAQQPAGSGSLASPIDNGGDVRTDASVTAEVPQQAEKMSTGMDVKKLALKKRPHPDL